MFRGTVTVNKLAPNVGPRSGNIVAYPLFRSGKTHQPSHRDSDDGERRTKTAASMGGKTGTVLRRNRGEEADNSKSKLQTEAVDIRALSASDLRKKMSHNLSHEQKGSLFHLLSK
jgi:hypothetical protein